MMQNYSFKRTNLRSTKTRYGYVISGVLAGTNDRPCFGYWLPVKELMEDLSKILSQNMNAEQSIICFNVEEGDGDTDSVITLDAFSYYVETSELEKQRILREKEIKAINEANAKEKRRKQYEKLKAEFGG